MVDVTKDIKAEVRNSGYNAIAKGERKTNACCNISRELSVYIAQIKGQSHNCLKKTANRGGQNSLSAMNAK